MWGNCNSKCNGEQPHPSSPYNLANGNIAAFTRAWSDGFYNLGAFEDGYCVTYDPPNSSQGGITNGLYFLMGHKSSMKDLENYKSSSSSNYMMYSFDIYLHEKVFD